MNGSKPLPILSRKATALITDVLHATEEFAFLGGKHPDDQEYFEKQYLAAKKRLERYIEELEAISLKKLAKRDTQVIEFDYLDHHGEITSRRVVFQDISWSPAHEGYFEEGWVLNGHDLVKNGRRTFALSNIKSTGLLVGK